MKYVFDKSFTGGQCWGRFLLGSLLLLGSIPRTVLAQAADSGSKEAWVVSYALVVLCVGLGLFIVSRPSRREKKIRKK